MTRPLHAISHVSPTWVRQLQQQQPAFPKRARCCLECLERVLVAQHVAEGAQQARHHVIPCCRAAARCSPKAGGGRGRGWRRGHGGCAHVALHKRHSSLELPLRCCSSNLGLGMLQHGWQKLHPHHLHRGLMRQL